MKKSEIKKYAELIVSHGVNIQKNQPLVILSPVSAAELTEELAKAAYKRGAADVEVIWSDEIISRLGFKNKSVKELSYVPAWQVEQREEFIRRNIAYLGILSDDPDAFKGLSVKKLSASRRARGKAFEKFRSYTSSNKIRWCLFGYPSKKWAKKMFPSLTPKQALEKQWEYIAKTMRLDEDDPIKAWEIHQKKLADRCKFLNDAKIKYFRYKNSIGTDFTIGMPKGYRFCGGAEIGALDGVPFTANMPTEEVFSSPDRSTANGTLVSAMPLCRNGQIIKDFYLKFDKGRIVDFGAKEGYDNLKSIIDTDEGSHYLGEIAIIGYNSPIRQLDTLFYETLYDENASCHFAIGDCYPACLDGGENMSEEELKEHGLNSSIEHVDFMVGTSDLSIVAECEDGREIIIFKDGDWSI
ncbi:MAG: aminopeptidase [Clostridia bacterium]|nr:aminopeptidase [Clostridia bacterium]